MKKMFTALVTAALFTTLAAPTYAACPQNAANHPNQNCPTAKCTISNILQGNNNAQQLPSKYCNWNTVLQNLVKPNENSTTCSNCNNQNPNCINGSCSNQNQTNNNNCNNQNQSCTNGNCNNQNQGSQKPTPAPDNSNNNNNQTNDTPASQESDYAAKVVSLVNVERAKEGLAPLKADTQLSAAAKVRAQEIVSVFDHTRPNGSSCFTVLKEMGIAYRGAGENIAYGQKTPEEVVSAWMKSEGHRANIMNKQFTTIGIGYHTVGNTAYWAQLFMY